MATFDATQSDRFIDLTQFNIAGLDDGTPTILTPNVYRLEQSSTTFQEFVGTGFIYDKDALIAGTITDITIVENGATLYEITGLGLTVADLDAFVDANKSQEFLQQIFAGNDTFDGSDFNDHLLSFAGNDQLDGGLGNDTLEGGAGNDTLDGVAGKDSMDGGAGADLYFVDDAGDKAVDSGVDTDKDEVVSTVTYTIDASIENLTLAGKAAINGTGNTGDNELFGNAAANTLDGKAGADTMTGGGGNDTYIVDNVGDKIVEAKGAGTDLVKSSVTYTLDANIENLTLTGTDTINGTGNELANTIIGNDVANQLNGLAGADSIQGGDGADTIDGGLGNDTMRGGDGDDTYIVDSIADLIFESANEGFDTVLSSVTFSLAGANGLNDLKLVAPDTFNPNGTGNVSSNHIIGNGGNNILDGGLNANNVTAGDTLEGGAGNDTYIIRNAKDQVVELTDAGHDLVQSALSFSLATSGANVEDLVLTGTDSTDGTGNDLANKLTGNAGANKLDGGEGADTMIGAAGNDSYVVDNAGDVITDASGIDEVFFTGKDQSPIKIYAGVEHYNFSLLDPAAGGVNFTGTTAANKITGTGLDDTLIGGSGNDTLDGGAGNDSMDGGTGNDTYVIDSPDDKIADSGKDTGDTVQTAGSPVITTIDLTDAFFSGIENVTFTGKADLNAVGNDAKNVLTGNDGVNLLIGAGGNDTLIGGAGDDTLAGDDVAGTGTGADSMAGGAGDDVYIVDNAGDKIVEGEDAGFDTVRSSISYILGANLNALVLLGTADLNGTGNDLANEIFGTDGKNILDGKGGDDTLEGFGGDDTYIVNSKLAEVIEGNDKTSGHDLIKSTVDFTLPDNVEDLTLIGGAHINGTGNELDNVLIGNAAFNKLDGGIGADTMKGGAGDDTYTVDNKGDIVDEKGGSGLNDTVIFQLTNPADQQAALKLISGVEHYDFSKFTININFAGDTAGNAITAGIGNDTLTGNGGNDTLDGGVGSDSLVGGAGNDTYVIDNTGDQVIELKGAGTDTIVTMFLDLAHNTLAEPSATFNVENLTLGDTDDADGAGNSAANLIRGNFFDNQLFGLAGNDTIFAGSGDDTLDGGLGNDSMMGGFGADTYILDSKSDRVVEANELGNDTVIAPFDYTLGANVENLVLTGTAKTGIGNDLGNHIVGNDLDNLLDGKGGIDKLEGGKGNDTYILRSIAEVVIEQADEGNDTVKTSWKEHHLAANVENLIFTAAFNNFGTGNSSDNLIVGNSFADTLQGAGGDDTLSGGAGTDSLVGGDDNDKLDGGAGADTLVGGTGNDTYVIDNAGDVIQEFGGSGIDTIQATISIDLGKYQAVGNIDVIENVTLTGAGALTATGNGLDNLLIGNTGANKLIGNGGDDTLDGGKGGDSMVGGAGNDTYVVDSTTDKIDETGGTGTDTVLSSITFNLTANGTTVKGDVENLTLTGTGAINGTGNALANIIHGNDGANKLDGGEGNDTITGHGGNDTVTGGAGNDAIDVADGNHTVRFTSVLDGHDVISNFDGDATGGQDTVDLDALFDSLSIAGADRAGRVTLTPGSGTVDVSIDVSAAHDGSNVITVATLNTTDTITVGQDVLVGT